MTLVDLLFLVFAGVMCIGAAGVVFTQSVARMALWLIVTLTSSAALFFLLDAEFVGTTQLLVYVGGTLVLLVFGVMMTGSGLRAEYRTRAVEIVTAGVLAIGLLGLMLNTVLATPWPKQPDGSGAGPGQRVTALQLGLSLAGVALPKPAVAVEPGQPARSAARATPGYLLPFELLSVHLLVVLIGAAYLARAKRRLVSGMSLPDDIPPSMNDGGDGRGPAASTPSRDSTTHPLQTTSSQWSPTN